MKRIAIVRPSDSFPTLITYIFSTRALSLFNSSKFEIDDYPILFANRLFWTLSKAFNSGYDLVIYAGHGVSDALIGQAEFLFLPIGTLIPMSDTSLAPKVRIFYSVACLTGRILGKDYVRKRTLSYVGSEDYVYVAYSKPERNYMEDYINVFLSFLEYLVRGHSVRESFYHMKDKMLYYINLYRNNEERWSYARFYRENLLRNYNGYRIYGKGDVYL